MEKKAAKSFLLLSRKPLSENDRQISAHAQRMMDDGRKIFRFDTNQPMEQP
jgi:hypothetical protein